MDIEIDHLLHHKRYIPTIAAWQHEEFGYLSPQGTIAQRVERLTSASDINRLPISLVAMSKQNGLAGSANLVMTTLTHKNLSPWLSSVFVPSEQRGKGIASKLSLAVTAEAARLGFETIYLFTPKNESLYARLGWETFDRTDINGVRVCVMARSVRPT